MHGISVSSACRSMTQLRWRTQEERTGIAATPAVEANASNPDAAQDGAAQVSANAIGSSGRSA